MNALSFIEHMDAPVLLPSILYLLFPLIWIVILSVLSIYDGKKYIRVVDEFAALLLSNFIASISTAGILYLSYRDVSRVMFLVFAVLTFLTSLFWRVLARLYFRSCRDDPRTARRVLIVGLGPLGQKVRAQIENAKLENLVLVGLVDDGYGDPADHLQALGGKDEISTLVRAHGITDVIIALPYSAYHQMGEIVERLDDIPVGVWVALGFFDLALYKTNIEDFADVPMLDLRASAIDDYQRIVKRAFDFVIGTILLLVALPIMGIISLSILLTSGPPVLFWQERVGENGRPFRMIKFRTMVRNAEQLQAEVERFDAQGNLIYKSSGDPRVTYLGRFLRRFSLDELPQFFNVVMGTMSLVGPRPEMPYLVSKYQPWQRKRFSVPPGITGWWQVNGRSDKPMHLHTEDDLYYIQNYSIFLDIQIIIQTIWVVLVGKGSY